MSEHFQSSRAPAMVMRPGSSSTSRAGYITRTVGRGARPRPPVLLATATAPLCSSGPLKRKKAQIGSYVPLSSVGIARIKRYPRLVEALREFVGFVWQEDDFADQMGVMVEAADVTEAGAILRAIYGDHVSVWNQADAEKPRQDSE